MSQLTPNRPLPMKTQTAQHTPTLVHHISPDTGNHWLEIENDGGVVSRPGDLSADQCEAIVRCCNSHAQLVAALESMIGWGEGYMRLIEKAGGKYAVARSSCRADIEIARAALAAAKEE